jgi:glycerol-3-phosphate O-acyltransferase
MRKEHQDAIRSEVVSRVFDRQLLAASQPGGPPLVEIINETLYHERERLRQPKGSHNSEVERAFYREIRKTLPKANSARERELLRTIIDRYVQEITGHFSPLVYGVATRAVPYALTGLLSGLSPLKMLSHLGQLPAIDDRILVRGDTELLRQLDGQGTLVFAPTHSSNLDSVIMGYTIYRIKLPPVVYGAGLNLFSNPVIGFFMRNLGAYTVDRRKTDPLYREALKEYAGVTLEFGYNNLFFPGGTRSRSNHIESRLKKGLLGTTVSAYLRNLKAHKARPRIFVIPCTISYPLVLEAATLIDDHFQRSGKARYIIDDDEFSQVRRWFDFFKGLMGLEQRIHVSFGHPMDPFGNPVDARGDSLDPRGRLIDPSRYLMVDGVYGPDPVRDAEYTRDLSKRVAEAFASNNVVFATNLLALTMLQMLRQRSKHPDLYRFLRTVGPETSLAQQDVEQHLTRLLTRLQALASEGRVLLDQVLEEGDVREILRDGLRSFGTYHVTPVVERQGIRLHVGDANLMVYYANRLSGYGLEELASAAGTEGS